MHSISRRDLLKAGAAAGLAPLSRYANALAPPDESFAFTFFSDSHVSLNRNVEECRSMFAEMRTLAPAFAINGGDVTEAGWAAELDVYLPLIKDLPFKVHHIPGNHDVRWSPLGPKIFEERVDKMHSSFTHQGVHFLLLDSTVPLEHWGHYETSQLKWAESDLKKAGRDTPVVVFTHHWCGRDQIMVDNEEELRKVLEPYNVKIVFNGHGHNDLLWKWDAIVSTMNKGLYQLSYEWVEVDRAKQEIRLNRRTKEKPQQTLLSTVPLAPSREKRPVWAIASANRKTLEEANFDRALEKRWDDGKWGEHVMDTLGDVPLVGLLPEDGYHLLTIRDKATGFQNAGVFPVKTKGEKIASKWETKLDGGVMSHVRLAGDAVFVSTMNGSVYKLRKADGKTVWQAKTNGYCHSSPLIDGGTVYVGSADGNLYAFDEQTGHKLWAFPTQGPVYGSPAKAHGIVCVGSGDGRIYGIEAKTGAKKWAYAMPSSNSAFTQSPVATDSERFYLGAWDNNLYALDVASGDLVWKQACCPKTYAWSPAVGGPVLGNGMVFVPADGNVFFAFDAKTGDPKWHVSSKTDKYGYSGPTMDGDRIYVGGLGDNGELKCLSASDGQEIWVGKTGSVIYDSTPAHGVDFVVIGSVDGVVSVFSKNDGAKIAAYRLPPGHLLSSPAVEGRTVYVGSYSDIVMALDIE